MATVSTLAGNGNRGFTNGVGTAASFDRPRGICMDNEGTLFVADHHNNCIRRITGDGLVTTTFAGIKSHGCTDSSKGRQAQFYQPSGVCVNDKGVVFVADHFNYRIRRITPNGIVSTLAGNGNPGYQDGRGQSAMFKCMGGAVIDGDGNVLVADSENHRIRKITGTGLVTTLGGNHQFKYPTGICVDSEGVAYVADSGNNCIRRIAIDGQVSLVAGSGHDGHQDGNGIAASFGYPTGIAVDGAGSLFVADIKNQRIRKIAVDGQVTTVAGTRKKGFRDGGGDQALFSDPFSLIIDDAGNIFVTDRSNDCIRKITGAAAPRATTGTFAGREQACKRHIANVERNRAKVLTTHADAVATAHTERQLYRTMLQQADAKVAREQQEERDADATALVAVTDACALLEHLKADKEAFKAKVVESGLNDLTIDETYEVLLMLGVTTATLAILRKEKVDGSVLIDLAEEDMLAVFNMLRFGDRRRLTNAVRRLSNHLGFPETLQGQPGALSWDGDAVGQWLTKEGFTSFFRNFAEHAIDGAVLLTLEQSDLTVLGVATFGEKSAMKRKLGVLKKQTYSGQVTDVDSNTASSSTTTTTSTTPSTEHLQAVLTAVLEENAELQQRMNKNKNENKVTTEIDPNFNCPILCELMEDPVVVLLLVLLW